MHVAPAGAIRHVSAGYVETRAEADRRARASLFVGQLLGLAAGVPVGLIVGYFTWGSL